MQSERIRSRTSLLYKKGADFQKQFQFELFYNTVKKKTQIFGIQQKFRPTRNRIKIIFSIPTNLLKNYVDICEQ